MKEVKETLKILANRQIKSEYLGHSNYVDVMCVEPREQRIAKQALQSLEGKVLVDKEALRSFLMPRDCLCCDTRHACLVNKIRHSAYLTCPEKGSEDVCFERILAYLQEGQ